MHVKQVILVKMNPLRLSSIFSTEAATMMNLHFLSFAIKEMERREKRGMEH